MSQIRMEFNLDNEYQPDVTSAPGETLQEVLDDRHMTQTELAERLGLTHKTVNQIIKGKAPITPDTAILLETVLRIPASFWTRYEANFRESLARIEVAQRLSSESDWLSKIPWRKTLKFGWIREMASKPDQLLEVLRFFGVASPRQYEEVYFALAVQWKRSASCVADPHATALWLRAGELRALELGSSLQWNDFDAKGFEQTLIGLRSLTRDRDPESFVPVLQHCCASTGVAIVFVPEVEGTRAGGVTRWLSPTRALIQLSVRHHFNDVLWFYFYHEAAHILKHSKKRMYMESEDDSRVNQEEREADQFAQDLLIPAADYERFIKHGRPSKASVERFADAIGVDPGIVVGRLQNDQLLPRNWFNDLKQRYDWKLE